MDLIDKIQEDKIIDYIFRTLLRKEPTDSDIKQTRNQLRNVRISYDEVIDNFRIRKQRIENVINDFYIRNQKIQASAIIKMVTETAAKNTYVGSYIIRNIHTDKIYIGESVDIFRRFNEHISALYAGTHHCQELQEDFNQNRDISNFEICPVYIYDIGRQSKKDAKYESLYLEAATYIKFFYAGYEIYNVLNPFQALVDGNEVSHEYKIENKLVLHKLYSDPYEIIPQNILTRMQKYLQEAMPGEFDIQLHGRYEIRNFDIETYNRERIQSVSDLVQEARRKKAEANREKLRNRMEKMYADFN